MLTELQPTAMALALVNAPLKDPVAAPIMGSIFRASFKPGVGLKKVRSWDARLSFKTAQHLKRTG